MQKYEIIPFLKLCYVIKWRFIEWHMVHFMLSEAWMWTPIVGLFNTKKVQVDEILLWSFLNLLFFCNSNNCTFISIKSNCLIISSSIIIFVIWGPSMVFVGCWSYTLSLVTLIIIYNTTFGVVTLIGVKAFESNFFPCFNVKNCPNEHYRSFKTNH